MQNGVIKKQIVNNNRYISKSTEDEKSKPFNVLNSF